MPKYSYRAKSIQGETLNGFVEAPNADLAAALLREQNLIILELEERETQPLTDKFLHSLNRVRAKEIVFFSHQLATLISATVPLVRALRTIVKQTPNPYFQIVIAEIASDVDGGMKFSQSLARYSNIFDNFFVQMVRAGETTGRLDKVLEYLAQQKEKDYTLRQQIRGAMIYPAFILAVLLIIAFLMLAFVLPRLSVVLQETGARLPWPTLVLIGLSNFFQKFWWLVLILFLVLGVVIYYLRTLAEVGFKIDVWKLRLPIFGPLWQKIYFIRFTRSLASLITAGVPIVRGLEISAEIVGHQFYRDLILQTAKKVETGQPLTIIFVKSKYIPPMITNMLNIGEETGRLDQILEKVADFYDGELRRAIASLASLIEPVIIILLGLATAFLVVSILLPIYNLTSAI